MIEVPQLAGKTIAVMGLGRSGLAAARALMASGVEVWAWDDFQRPRETALAEGVPLKNLTDCDWSKPAAVLLSPGVPFHYPAPHPVIGQASAAGCEIIGDVELLFRTQGAARFVGVTGTNGKSTTTALIGHILSSAGLQTEVGGNLGTPAMALQPLDARGTYVLEMSSYQLDLTYSVTFDVAVLVNVAADHLDRHGGMAGYVAAKRRIFMNQGPEQAAVVALDDAETRTIFADLDAEERHKLIPISGLTPIKGGVYVTDGVLYDDTEGDCAQAADLTSATTLPGVHNWQNASAAYAAAKLVGIAPQTIADGILSYPGLAHRQEHLADINGVRFVNDSKATNADAAAKALACYTNIYWIAGGRAKEGGIEGLAPWFDRIAHAYLIGEAADVFAKTLKGSTPFTECGDLATATHAATNQARAEGRPKPVVLLSPACASFDQFDNFEARGDAFRAMVQSMIAAHGTGAAP